MRLKKDCIYGMNGNIKILDNPIDWKIALLILVSWTMCYISSYIIENYIYIYLR